MAGLKLWEFCGYTIGKTTKLIYNHVKRLNGGFLHEFGNGILM